MYHMVRSWAPSPITEENSLQQDHLVRWLITRLQHWYLVLVCFSLFTHSRGLLAWPTGVRKKHGHPSSRALHLTLPLEGAALPAPVEEDILAFLASLEWELAVVRLEGVKDARTPLHVEFRGAVAL